MNVNLLLSGIISQSGLSREEIADRMSVILNIDVSHHMLNCWTAESKKQHRFPLEFFPAFCKAIGNSTLTKKLIIELLKPFNMTPITANELYVFELFKLKTQKDALDKRIKQQEKFINAKAEFIFEDWQ